MNVTARLAEIDAEIATDHARYLRAEWALHTGEARWWADEVDRLMHERWLLERDR